MASEDEEDEEYAYSAGELDDEDEEQLADEKAEDDDDDVEWENVDASPLAADARTARPSAAPYPPDPVAVHSDDICQHVPNAIDAGPKLAQVDYDHVNRSLADTDAAVAAASVARTRRRPCLRLTRDEKQRETALHQMHLLLLLALRIKWTRWSRHSQGQTWKIR